MIQFFADKLPPERLTAGLAEATARRDSAGG